MHVPDALAARTEVSVSNEQAGSRHIGLLRVAAQLDVPMPWQASSGRARMSLLSSKGCLGGLQTKQQCSCAAPGRRMVKTAPCCRRLQQEVPDAEAAQGSAQDA